MNEHQQLDYKRIWKDDWLKTICAFANAQGGRLVVGCDDAGNPVGLKKPKKLMEDIPNKVRDVLGVMVDVNLCKNDEAIEVSVEPYPNPISYKGEYFYRSGTTTQSLNGTALERFLLRKRGVHWDGVPVPNLSVEELSSEALQGFRDRAAESKRMPSADLALSDPMLLEKLKLKKDGNLKNAAVLLFHPDPEQVVTGAFIKIGFFRSESDLRFQDEVHGDLFAQIEKTMDFILTKYTEATISYRGIQRVETYPVPEEALREAILNAVVHRDYSIPAPIQIRIYSDRIRIWNPGRLPSEWSVEKLFSQHASHPFNPDVANAIFRAGMIEAWGRGIEKIMESCAADNVPPPEICCEQGDIWVEFPFSTQKNEGGPMGGLIGGLIGGSIDLTERQVEILSLIQNEPKISKKRISETLKINLSAMDKHISSLKEKGVLKRIGGTRGHWEVLVKKDLK